MFAAMRPTVRVCFALTVVPLAAVFTGCHSSERTPVVSASSVVSASPRFAPSLTAAASIQSQPLYQQAERACQSGRYAQAAALLQRLSATPKLSPDALAFCRSQRDLCLRHLSHSAAPKSFLPASPPAPPVTPGSADCGPRALAVVCQRLGVKTDVARLRVLAGTTHKGTSMAGLAKACEAVGLKSEGVQVSREALGDVDLPALAWVNQNHYVALLSLQGDAQTGTATIADPNASAEQTIEREKLLRLCGGYLLLVHR